MDAAWLLYLYISVPFGLILLVAHIMATRSLKKFEESERRQNGGA